MRGKRYDLIIEPYLIVHDGDDIREMRLSDEESERAARSGMPVAWRITAQHVAIVGTSIDSDERVLCDARSRDIAELIKIALERVMGE